MNILIIFLVALVGLAIFVGCMFLTGFELKNKILNFVKDLILTCIIFLDFGVIIGTIERLA